MLKAPRAADERQWPTVVGVCVGLLVLPLAGWLLLAPPPASPAVKAAAPAPTIAKTSREPAPPARPSQPNGRAAPTTVQKAESGGVDGQVIGPDDKPIAEASVRCSIGDRELEATTDEAGRFHFAAEAAGCSAVAKKRGLAASAAVTLGAGAVNQLRLEPGSGIAGIVVDDGGVVMSYFVGVESFAAADGGTAAAPPALQVNDAAGAFALDDLPPGRYVLAVSAPRHPVARTAPIDVRAGQMTSDVKIALARGGNVVGTVVDAHTKKPLVGAFVFVETPPTSAVRSVPAMSAPPAGDFTLEGACPETCTLHASLPGYAPAALPNLHVPASGELRVEVALGRLGDAPP